MAKKKTKKSSSRKTSRKSPKNELKKFEQDRLAQIKTLVGIAKLTRGKTKNILYYPERDSVYFKWDVISQFADLKKISIEIEGPIHVEHKSDKYGPYDEYQCIVKASTTDGRTVKAIGFETTRSPFFMINHKTNEIIEYEKIPRSKVQKSAITQAYNRAVQELLAIKGISLEDVKKCGIDISDMTVVDTVLDYSEFLERIKNKNQPQQQKKATQPQRHKKQKKEWTREEKEKILIDMTQLIFKKDAHAARNDIAKILNRRPKFDPKKGILPDLSDEELTKLLRHYWPTYRKMGGRNV